MQLLLDTHALLWWLAGDAKQLSRRARAAIGNEDNTIYSQCRFGMGNLDQAAPGKLDAGILSGRMSKVIARQAFMILDITMDHAERAGGLPGTHKDPFDRMLIAQAQAENLALVSNESVFDAYAVTRIW